MTVRLNPYLSFRDNAREAMDFYQSVFGGELTVSTFGEFHASEDPAEQDKVMHSQLETPDGLMLMGADTPERAWSTGHRQAAPSRSAATTRPVARLLGAAHARAAPS